MLENFGELKAHYTQSFYTYNIYTNIKIKNTVLVIGSMLLNKDKLYLFIKAITTF